jgi:hypothetical protein
MTGRYFVEARLPGTSWYISSIALSGSGQSGSADAARDGIRIKTGERVTGLTVSIREDAASLRGSVVLPKGKTISTTRLRVHLVPAEPEEKENVLRFFEAVVKDDEAFQLSNIAPGRYFMIARQADDAREDYVRPLAWDREARIKLWRDAEAAKNAIELKPCQNLSGSKLTYTPAPGGIEQDK